MLQQSSALLARGELPEVQLLEGIVLLVAAVLLIVPGFITDGLAILGLVPFLRRRLVRWIVSKTTTVSPSAEVHTPDSHRINRIIEGDFRRED